MFPISLFPSPSTSGIRSCYQFGEDGEMRSFLGVELQNRVKEGDGTDCHCCHLRFVEEQRLRVNVAEKKDLHLRLWRREGSNVCVEKTR